MYVCVYVCVRMYVCMHACMYEDCLPVGGEEGGNGIYDPLGSGKLVSSVCMAEGQCGELDTKFRIHVRNVISAHGYVSEWCIKVHFTLIHTYIHTYMICIDCLHRIYVCMYEVVRA